LPQKAHLYAVTSKYIDDIATRSPECAHKSQCSGICYLLIDDDKQGAAAEMVCKQNMESISSTDCSSQLRILQTKPQRDSVPYRQG
jgi:hypothetical protein